MKYYIDKYDAKILVDVNYHLYRNNNKKNLDKIRELCDELGFLLSTTYALVMPLERVIDYCNHKPSKDTTKLRELLLVDIDEGIEASNKIKIDSCPFIENQTNISWDLTVPLCCTVIERENKLLADNFLDISSVQLKEIKKRQMLCIECMSLGLPAYNMGFNSAGWRLAAEQKTSTDMD